MKILHWFRQDLRIKDNPSLFSGSSKTVLPVYILDETSGHPFPLGAASKWWLHYSLHSLKKDLQGALSFYKGNPKEILLALVEKHGIQKVVWNRCYDPWRMMQDQEIKQTLRQKGIDVESFNGSLLWEPFDILKQDKTPYKVFTPFYQKGCLGFGAPRKPLPVPQGLDLFLDPDALPLRNLSLLPTHPWSEKFKPYWSVGEKSAWKQFNHFVDGHLDFYKSGRDFPSLSHVSRLSPHLHFGEISPHQLWDRIQKREPDVHSECFLKELGWREFSYYLLYHFPTLPHKNFQQKFDDFPWEKNDDFLRAWQKGLTGYPIIDAGMKELWETGYMHNRVRMIVGSFLIKNLLIHWKKGEQWFFDCLVDADLASNAASWQWVAGSGADAAPYFRIFNPITQAKKFDAEGLYIKKFVPELKNLPVPYIFEPWNAPPAVLEKAGVTLGKTYPYPIIDLKESRQKALYSFSCLRN